MAEKRLTDKQEKFVDLWNGNATVTAAACGYSNPKQAGSRLLKNVDISRRISERRVQEAQTGIMSRQERQQFWTDTVKSSDEDIKDKLRASELLGKSEGDFFERVEQSGEVKLKIQWAK